MERKEGEGQLVKEQHKRSLCLQGGSSYSQVFRHEKGEVSKLEGREGERSKELKAQRGSSSFQVATLLPPSVAPDDQHPTKKDLPRQLWISYTSANNEVVLFVLEAPSSSQQEDDQARRNPSAFQYHHHLPSSSSGRSLDSIYKRKGSF